MCEGDGIQQSVHLVTKYILKTEFLHVGGKKWEPADSSVPFSINNLLQSAKYAQLSFYMSSHSLS